MISETQRAMIAKIRAAIDAFERDGVVIARSRFDLNILSRRYNPQWDFQHFDYVPVPKPAFVWPAGVNAARMRKTENGLLEFQCYGSPDVFSLPNFLKGDTIQSMEVGTWYKNPNGEEQPVKGPE